MQAATSPKMKRITLERAAEVLIDPTQLRILLPFWGRDRSISEAAAELDVKANTLLKQVKRLQSYGLLYVGSVVTRRGRNIKRYRTTAECFFVPYSSTSAKDLEEGMAHKERYFENLLRRNLVTGLDAELSAWGLKIYRDEAGRLTMFPTPHPERDYNPLHSAHPATYSVWYDDLELDFADAKALQRELHALCKRYRGRKGGQRYLLRLGMTPLLDI